LDLIPDLSEAQRNQVQEIRRVFLPKVDKIRQSLYIKRAELADLLFIEPADREKIYAVAEQILRHQSDLEKEVIEHILEERELLSPSQKRIFYQVIVQQFATGGLGVHDVKGRKT
jgi:Spy/CpxP family protein refolding chaperone